MFALLESRQHDPIKVAVVGAGAAGRSIVRQIERTPGMRVCLLVSRYIGRAARAWKSIYPNSTVNQIGVHPGAWEHDPEAVAESDADVVVEATGDLHVGTKAVLAALRRGKIALSFSAETDALLGPYFARLAKLQGTVYGFLDGDQPGVMKRLYDDCRIRGWDVRGIFNCKTHYNRRATPLSVSEWVSENSSRRMTCAFTDGTKMQLEQNVVANATGFLPLKRGMVGIQTVLKNAATDIIDALKLKDDERVIDYTLGGDLRGGVFVLCKDRDDDDSDLLDHYKVDHKRPWRVIYRPFHAGPFEVPVSIAEAFFLKSPTVVPERRHAVTVAVAKRDLRAGEILDGVGGETVYGQLAREDESRERLPVSVSNGARLTRDLKADEVVYMHDVEIASGPGVDSYFVSLTST